MSEKNAAKNFKAPPVVDVTVPPPGIIGWFASNHVASNLLMVFIFAFGLLAIFELKKESMPSIVFDRVNINVAYPGAGPEEVELGIVVKIEEALNSIEGICYLKSRAQDADAASCSVWRFRRNRNEIPCG